MASAGFGFPLLVLVAGGNADGREVPTPCEGRSDIASRCDDIAVGSSRAFAAPADDLGHFSRMGPPFEVLRRMTITGQLDDNMRVSRSCDVEVGVARSGA